MTNAPAFSQVEELLRKCNLSEYYERFIAEGFDELRSLLEVTEADLIAMDVKRGHRRRLQREISTLKGIPQNLPLYMPSGPSLEDSLTTGSSNGAHPHLLQKNRSNVIYVNSANQNDVIVGSSQPPRDCTTKEDDPLDIADQRNNGNGKRKYRRHPKRDKNAPVKPPSAYVMFAHRVREEYQGQNISFPDMAKIVGDRWKTIPSQEKEAIKAQAAKAKEKYRAQLESYKTTDQWKQHQEYLKDFKSRYQTSQFRGGNAGNNQRKRSKIEPSPETDNGGHSGYSSRSTSLGGYQSSGSSSGNNENHHRHGNAHLHDHSGGPHLPNSDFNTQNFHHNSYHVSNCPSPIFGFNSSNANGVSDKVNLHHLRHHSNSFGTGSTPLTDLCGKDSDGQSSTSMPTNGSGNRNIFNESGENSSAANSDGTLEIDDTINGNGSTLVTAKAPAIM